MSRPGGASARPSRARRRRPTLRGPRPRRGVGGGDDPTARADAHERLLAVPDDEALDRSGAGLPRVGVGGDDRGPRLDFGDRPARPVGQQDRGGGGERVAYAVGDQLSVAPSVRCPAPVGNGFGDRAQLGQALTSDDGARAGYETPAEGLVEAAAGVGLLDRVPEAPGHGLGRLPRVGDGIIDRARGVPPLLGRRLGVEDVDVARDALGGVPKLE